MSKDRDPICMSELRGQVEDRTEGKTGNGETKFTVGGDKKRAGLVLKFKDKNITHLFFHSFGVFKSPVVPKIELV